MLLIPDNTTLRSFIPNSFASTIPDVPTLYDKIMPFLMAAEQWFLTEFIPEPMMITIIDSAQQQSDPLYFFPRRIVALKAWLNAIPSLDVLITHNGIGAAQTQAIQPASKAKIDRLIQSVADELDNCLMLLPALLHAIPGWRDSQQAQLFTRTLFQDYSDIWTLNPKRSNINPNPTTIHEFYKSIIPTIDDLETQIGESWISLPILRRIRKTKTHILQSRGAVQFKSEAFATLKHKPSTLIPEPSTINNDSYIINRVRSAVLETLSSQTSNLNPEPSFPIPNQKLEQAAAYIIANPDIYPEWKKSSTARLFRAPGFHNKKSSSAFWL